MKASTKVLTVNIVTFVFIFLFVYTAASKLSDPSIFRSTIGQSQLIGRYKNFISIALPVTELIVAGMLFFPQARTAGLLGAFGLLFLFSLYIGYMLYHESNLPCSCGGVLKQMTWEQHLLFNLLLGLLAWLGIRLKLSLKQSFLKKHQANRKICIPE